MKLRRFFPLLILAFCCAELSAIGDSTRMETGLDQVYAQYNLTGQGTIFAMIDRGIDYTHPDFIDANGDTRIAYIYDMLDPTGANDPNNPYGVGTIYSRTQIDQALDGGATLPTNDRFGHGTSTTGIAAGNGSGIPSLKYRGVAYEATIIVVKAFQDGFPAFNGNPGQTGFFNPDYLEIGLDFVSDKVAELGLPSVTVMNLGSIGGSTDGTSKVCRAMDEFVGPGKLLVCGSGDDGGADNRASGTFAEGDTATLEINKGEAGNLRFELWYPDVDRISLILERPDGSMTSLLGSPITNQVSDLQNLTGFTYYHQGSFVDFSGATSPTRQVLIDINGAVGLYKFHLIGSSIQNGSFSASLNPATYFNTNEFRTFVQQGGNISDYASAFKVISPTSYVADNSWVDLDGIARNRDSEGLPGEIWLGSSAGPTLDGRIGIDIAAPGEVMMAAYSPNTWYSQFRFNMAQDGNGFYGLQNAVSAANPHLAGILCLLLELNDSLTSEQVKNLLQLTARQDAFTGPVPNNIWGHGKLDALALADAVANSLPIERDIILDGLHVFPNPAAEQIRYRIEGILFGESQMQLLDLQGQSVQKWTERSPEGTINLSELPPGIYFLQWRQGNKIMRKKIIHYLVP
ncbi:MAG: S8 family peptidase [Bacteroidota bacterium]